MSRTCARCGAPAAKDDRFCSSCGNPLEPPGGGERKIATMLFADLVGSTELAASLDPEELRGRLAEFFEIARAALTEHGGTVEKYIGDAVMAVFGAPVAHGDDPDRAVAAGLSLVERVASLDGELRIRVGIETGEILAVAQPGDLAVTGEAVNAAARLQQAAAPGQVLVGERAARACRRARLEPGGVAPAKGLERPLVSWRAAAGGEDAKASGAPLIGRESDLELLRLVARRAVSERTPQLVMMIGEAGVGKTRLASELVSELTTGPGGWRAIVGRSPAYGRGIAFWALGEILRDAAGAPSDAPAEEVEDSLRGLLGELGADDAAEIAAALAVAIGGTEDEGASAEDELKAAWRRLVALLAADRPLLIGVDDAHWADNGLLELLEAVAFGLHGAPVMILCTTRPELAEQHPEFGRAVRNLTQLELPPLDPSSAVRLAELLLPGSSREEAAQVADASGGNPFFAEEVSRAIGEDGGTAELGRLPDTVQAAVAARIDLLPPEEKRVLQHAAVLGHHFSQPQLELLLGAPPGEALEGLRRRALVSEWAASGSGDLAFRHQLIGDVAYASLPRAEAAQLHERAAEALRSGAGERFPEFAELYAHHLDHAAELSPTDGRRRAAHNAMLEAAAVAIRRGAGARAQELYEEAADLAADDGARVDALQEAAELALRRWRGDHAVRLLREAAAVAERSGMPARAAQAYARVVEVGTRMRGISGDLPDLQLESMLEHGRALVADDDLATRARLLLDEAWIAWYSGRGEDMQQPAQEGLEVARAAGDLALVQSGLDAVTASDWHHGRQRSAVEHTRQRLELLENAPRTPALDVELSDALHMMVMCLVQTADFREAASFARQGAELDRSRGVDYGGWNRGADAGLLPGRLGRDAGDGDPRARGVDRRGAAAAGRVRRSDRLRGRDPRLPRRRRAGEGVVLGRPQPGPGHRDRERARQRRAHAAGRGRPPPRAARCSRRAARRPRGRPVAPALPGHPRRGVRRLGP